MLKVALGRGGREKRNVEPTYQTPSLIPTLHCHRLVGLVVKASASRAEGPGFESRLRRDFFGVESYQ